MKKTELYTLEELESKIQLDLQLFDDPGDGSDGKKKDDPEDEDDDDDNDANDRDKKRYSRKQINTMLANSTKSLKGQVDSLTKQIADLTKNNEAARLASLSEEDRKKEEENNIRKELDELKSKAAVAELRTEALKVLSANDIDAEAIDLLNITSQTKADDVSNNINTLKRLLDKHTKAEVKKRYKNSETTPRTSANSATPSNNTKSLAERAAERRIIK